MKKRVVALFLAMAMITSAAGCGNAGNKTAVGTAAENALDQALNAQTDKDGKVNQLVYAKGLPIVDKDAYTFSLFCDGTEPSSGSFYMLDALKEQTNVSVDLKMYPYETAKERLNLDLNSGDYADVISGWTLSDSSILTYGVGQGVFIPLEGLIAKYAPNIEAILNLPGVREKMTAPDGHIYTIPYVCDDTTVGYSPYINTAWLDRVGMSMPETTEEFEAVLKAFKEQDANGNGDANDEIPFSADPNNKNIQYMTGWFGLPMNKNGLALKDGKVVYGGISTQYRNFLSYMHKLYAEGLIDVELFTQDLSTWQGKGNKDLYGVSFAYGSSEFSGIPQAAEKSDYDAVPVLNTDSGGVWLRDTEGYSVYRTQAVITDNAKNPEAIIRWFDNAFALENGIGITRGPVGTIVFKDGEGYRAIDNNTLSEADQDKYSWGNLWPQSVPKYMPAGFTYVEDNPMYNEKKAVEALYEKDLTKEIIPSFWVDLDNVDKFSDITTAVLEYFSQQQAMFVTGELDIDNDADWQSYVNGIKALGLNDWLKIQGVEQTAE